MVARLGINIDHVATVRQARGENYPSIKTAAEQSIAGGADQITIHLREDRRHIQDSDLPVVKKVTAEHNKLLNLEVGLNEEIVKIAIQTAPDWICLVPEKREERTTEGGLNLRDAATLEKLRSVLSRFAAEIPKTKVSLFVEANEEVLQICSELDIHAVEIHTGEYARAVEDGLTWQEHLDSFLKGKEIIEKKNMGYHAGHGLTDKSLRPLAQAQIFAEYNIGHWVIAQSIFQGLSSTVKQLNDNLKEASK